MKQNWGYCTDIITQKSIDWLKEPRKQPEKQFFLMCHHKTPHRQWEAHPRTRTCASRRLRIRDL